MVSPVLANSSLQHSRNTATALIIIISLLRENEMAGFLSPGAIYPRFIASDINQGSISHISEIIEL
jgi:hypothetical protein